MTQTSNPSNIHKGMFLEFVAMLSATTMQHMGKTINPLTGKTDINMEAAQATIDILEMIEAKTRGNRDRDEDRFVANALTTLRMNFVETKASVPQPSAPGATPPASPTPPPEESGKDPRFHKSYG